MAFLPTPALLIPEIATGASEELANLRGAARAAVDWVCEGGHDVGVLIPGQTDHPLSSWSTIGFGRRIGDGTPVDLPEAIAGWLLAGRTARVIGPGSSLAACDGLLVMGDGSSSRTDKAPGHLHPGAVPFDDSVLAAVAAGSPTGLQALDLGLATEVGAAGAPAWQALGEQVAAVTDPVVDRVDDRYGVLYFVARWNVRWADPT